MYLGTGIDVHEHCTQIQQCLEACPGDGDHIILGADVNVKLQWTQDGDTCVPGGVSSKLHNVLSNLASKNLDVIPQVDHSACTHWTRKLCSVGSQIDIVATNKRARCTEVEVISGSRAIVGTDHEQLTARILLQHGTVKKKRSGGPRVMTAELSAVPDLQHASLVDLSRRFTKPAPSQKFVPSNAVRVLGRVARNSRRPDDWIRYMRELREERVAWRHKKWDEASTNWKSYKWAKKARASSWQPGFGAHQEGHPLTALEEHFTKVFTKHAAGEIDSQLNLLRCRVEGDSPHLSEREVAEAVAAGRRGRAVGEDLVSQELLQAIIDCDGGLAKLTAYFDDILQSGQVPKDWNRSILALLPKTSQPMKAGELRPVALNSHTSKTFARIVLGRMSSKLATQGSAQHACPKRQAAEYLWSAAQATQLSYEWGQSMAMVKLDIAKAFDAVCRVQLGTKLKDTLCLQHPSEVKCLLSMLEEGTAVLRTDWGDAEVAMTSGVKQGAVESPCIFAWIMDLVMQQVECRVSDSQWMPDIGVNKLSFMDDMLLWDADVITLQSLVSAVHAELGLWGLTVNLQKSSLITWGDTKGDSIRFGNDVLKALTEGQALHVMGVPIGPGISPSQQIAALLSKARSSFHANYQVLHSNAAIHDRVRLLQKIVWTAMAWAAGIVMPSQTVTNMINSFQWDCISSMAKFRRRSDEFFVDFRTRACRSSRAILFASNCERWGCPGVGNVDGFVGLFARKHLQNGP